MSIATPTGAVPAAPAPHESLAYYKKFVIQLSAVAAAVLLVFVDVTTHGGPVNAVTWWVAVGALVQAVATYWPKVWWTKFLASAVGVVFSAIAAALTHGFSTAEILVVLWQLVAWASAGAVSNSPQPVPPAPDPYPVNPPADGGFMSLRMLLVGLAVAVVALLAPLLAPVAAHAAPRPVWQDSCLVVLTRPTHFQSIRQAQFAACRRYHHAGPVVLVRARG